MKIVSILPWILAAVLAVATPCAAGSDTTSLIGTIRSQAIQLNGASNDYADLLAAIGDASIILLGESTHGSEEFYRERIRITRQLIIEKRVDAVIFESPWEPMQRVDAYVRGSADTIDLAFAGFDAYPRWPRDNPALRDFAGWLRDHNRRMPRSPVRFWGMDLYSVQASAGRVIDYLARTRPDTVNAARQDLRCFNEPELDLHRYGLAAAAGKIPGCGAGAQRQRAELLVIADNTAVPDEELFDALQNAELVANGERYHRLAYQDWIASWNLRERYLAATVQRLMKRLETKRGRPARVVIWAHNTHIGDGRATGQLHTGELSLGQLLREQFGDHAYLVGFSTHAGSVRASSRWGGSDQVVPLRPSLQDSWPDLMHRTRIASSLLIIRGNPVLETALNEARLTRAIGVNYLPRQEKSQHYSNAILSRQFDALVHLDTTSALKTTAPAGVTHPSRAASR